MTDTRLPRGRPVICLITDRQLVRNGDLVAAASAAVDGGVNLVQLREKDLPTRELLALAEQLRDRIGDRAIVSINGRADVAFAARLGGLHLPSDGISATEARAILGPDRLIGRSVHSIQEITELRDLEIDYVELGTIFPSRSHPGGSAIGIESVRAALVVSDLPLLAVGGITPANAGEVIAAGAAGVAVISSILGASDPKGAARSLATGVESAWGQRVGASA